VIERRGHCEDGRFVSFGHLTRGQGQRACKTADDCRNPIKGGKATLAPDFTIAGDVFHDFQATGGFRENIGVEVRLAKFFFPPPRPN
jgi:hypothetical protein